MAHPLARRCVSANSASLERHEGTLHGFLNVGYRVLVKSARVVYCRFTKSYIESLESVNIHWGDRGVGEMGQGVSKNNGDIKGGSAKKDKKSLFRLTVIRGITAAIGGFGVFLVNVVLGHPLDPYLSKAWEHFFPPSNQSIVAKANDWPQTYQYSGQSGSSYWQPYVIDPGVRYRTATIADELDMKISGGGNGGTHAFFADRSADLPNSDFFLSAQVRNEKGCQFGLVFRANLSNEYAWLYINEIGQVYAELDVFGSRGYLGSVFHKAYSGPVASISSIGVVQYNNKYVIELNGDHAIGSITFSAIDHLVGNAGLTGSGIGIGMCSCQATASYR